MKKTIHTLLITLLSFIAGSVFAHDYHQGSIQIDHPWSREAPPTATVIAGFFQLKNTASSDDFLLSASTPIAERVEIHTHEMADGMMQMKKIDAVRVGSMQSVMFEPGSYHLMIFNPSKSYKKGERFPMTLTFKKAGSIEVEMAIEEAGHVHTHAH